MQCHGCKEPTTIFWLKNDVWDEIAEHDPQEYRDPSFVHCLDCCQKILGRPVLLDDLDIPGYLKTAKNSPETMAMLTDNVRAVVKGAADSIPPSFDFCGWQMPDGDLFQLAYSIGHKLGSNTAQADVIRLIPALLDQCDNHFPLREKVK